MIELPEALTLARQFNTAVVGKEIADVLPPTKPHAFCWFSGNPVEYAAEIKGQKVTGASGFGIFAELDFENRYKLCINDGVNVRYSKNGVLPKDYQLSLLFTDGSALVMTVAMYGGIVLHRDGYDNEYYLKSKNSVLFNLPEFDDRFFRVIAESKPSLSMKAFLATEQRFPGIGNGVVQDILFNAGQNPRRKLSSLDKTEREELLSDIKLTLEAMTKTGGRDTEKDLFGNYGGYITKMSKKSAPLGCPVCGGNITKETYLGGSVYYCPVCQKR